MEGAILYMIDDVQCSIYQGAGPYLMGSAGVMKDGKLFEETVQLALRSGTDPVERMRGLLVEAAGRARALADNYTA